MKNITLFLSQVITLGLLTSPSFANSVANPAGKSVIEKKGIAHKIIHRTRGVHQPQPIAPEAQTGPEAQVGVPSSMSYTGWYGGAQVGYAYTITDYPCIDLIDGTVTFDRHNTDGIVGGLHFGYGYQFSNCWYLGLEVAGNLYSNKDKNDSGGGADFYKHKVTHSFAINPRIGYVFNGCGLVYAKLGVEFTRWTHAIDHNFDNIFFSKTKYEPGFAPGIGFAYLLTPNIIIGLEGSYVFYTNEPKVRNVRSTDHDFRDRAADFKLRVSYKI